MPEGNVRPHCLGGGGLYEGGDALMGTSRGHFKGHNKGCLRDLLRRWPKIDSKLTLARCSVGSVLLERGRGPVAEIKVSKRGCYRSSRMFNERPRAHTVRTHPKADSG